MSCVVCESHAVQLRPAVDALVVPYSMQLAMDYIGECTFISEFKKVNCPSPPETCCCSQFRIISKLEKMCRVIILFYHVKGKKSQVVNHEVTEFNKE